MNKPHVDKIFGTSTTEEWLVQQARWKSFLDKALTQEQLDAIVDAFEEPTEPTRPSPGTPDRSRPQRKSMRWNSDRENADRVKDCVTMFEAATFYGVQVDRHGDALCPFHREKTPSFHIYPGARGWYCYGCHEGGDVITFVQRLYGLPFHEALAKLGEDFHVGLNIGRKMTTRQRIVEANRAMTAQAEQQCRDQELLAAQEACDFWGDMVAVLDRILLLTKPAPPASMDDDVLAAYDFPDAYAKALHMLPETEYALERAELTLYEVSHNDPE